MSRFEKARENKQQTKKKQVRILFIALAVVLALGLASLLYENMGGGFEEEADLIDLDRTAAFTDVFGITHVRVYLLDDIEDKDLSAVIGGRTMEYSPEDNMWEISLDGYSAGEQLVIEIIAEDEGRVQEETINIGD